MAITLKYCITESDDATSFSVLETTGVYDASTNPTGWGAPNPTIASCTAATITLSQLTDAATNTYTDAVTVSVYPTLPNVTDTEVVLTAEDFDYGDDATFPDAVYKITYAVTSSSAAITSVTQYRAFTANLDCSIKTLADNVSICSCNCSGLEEQLREIYFWRRLLSSAICCGNLNQITKLIEKLTRLTSNCDGC